jgi:(2Fe-2S) ferredoxin/SAM-dependent methyltransferase
MEPFRCHVFVCDQKKPEGVPCCAARGSGAVIQALQREIAARGLVDEVQVTPCGSLGLCEQGPNMVVYPEGVWYCGVTEQDVSEIVGSHFCEGVVVERLARADLSDLRAEMLANRKKRDAAMRARDAAGVLPDEVTQTVRGFQESRVLLTAIELDLFTAIGAGAEAAEVAGRLGINARAAEMLLNALVAMQLLFKEKGVFQNTAIGKRFLVEGAPDDARMGLMHSVGLWRRWSTLTECVRTGTSVTYQEMDVRGADWTKAFIAAMDRGAAERAPALLRAVGAGGVRRMLDVGGGSAAYAIAFARANPELQAEVLDLEAVCELARAYIERAGLTDRVRTRPGDLRTDEFGDGYDLVLVSSICHMLSPMENRDLLRRCFDALAPRGRLVIQDFILRPDKTAPKTAALFALNMLVGTVAGSSYSVEEYTEWMRGAGLADIRHIDLPGPSGLMVGIRGLAG